MIEKIVEEKQHDALDIDYLKKKYKPGMFVVLDYMDDKQAPPKGTKGEIHHIDDIGQIHVKWDNGSGLALVPEIDEFHIEATPIDNVGTTDTVVGEVPAIGETIE